MQIIVSPNFHKYNNPINNSYILSHKNVNKFLDDTKDYPKMDRAVQEDNGSIRDEFEDFLGPDDDSLFLEKSSERQTSSEER